MLNGALMDETILHVEINTLHIFSSHENQVQKCNWDYGDLNDPYHGHLLFPSWRHKKMR